MWGSELKFSSSHDFSQMLESTSVWGSELKSFSSAFASASFRSTSVWGSELKCDCHVHQQSTVRLPLCEVVSWNNLPSSAPGGCLRLPLCEVVSWNILLFYFLRINTARLPLCEVVSWNILSQNKEKLYNLSTSVWGSELKCWKYNTYPPNS